jgi:hypothetical protein
LQLMVQLGYGPAHLDRGDFRADEFLGDGRDPTGGYSLGMYISASASLRARSLRSPFSNACG